MKTHSSDQPVLTFYILKKSKCNDILVLELGIEPVRCSSRVWRVSRFEVQGRLTMGPSSSNISVKKFKIYKTHPAQVKNGVIMGELVDQGCLQTRIPQDPICLIRWRRQKLPLSKPGPAMSSRGWSRMVAASPHQPSPFVSAGEDVRNPLGSNNRLPSHPRVKYQPSMKNCLPTETEDQDKGNCFKWLCQRMISEWLSETAWTRRFPINIYIWANWLLKIFCELFQITT